MSVNPEITAARTRRLTMIGNKSVIAIVPARGGSKGLPGKNARPMSGKPLIAWTIEQALDCPLLDAVVVSTDSEEIARVAQRAGARVPFMRPPALASDGATSVDVILHAIDTLEAMGESYRYVVLLEATSPLRDVADISGAIAHLAGSEECTSVVGVARAESGHPAYLMTVEGGLLRPMSGVQPTAVRRQELRGEYFYLEGSVYASEIDALRVEKSFYHSNTAPWVVERYKALEIDELSDFIAAEALMNAKLKGLFK